MGALEYLRSKERTKLTQLIFLFRVAHHIPCKIFLLHLIWKKVDNFPLLYLNSAHLNIDRDAVASHLNSESVAKSEMFAEENDYCSHNLDSAHVMNTGEEPLSTTELVSSV